MTQHRKNKSNPYICVKFSKPNFIVIRRHTMRPVLVGTVPVWRLCSSVLVRKPEVPVRHSVSQHSPKPTVVHQLRSKEFLSSRITCGLIRRRTEVGWCLGQETSLAPPCLNLRSFGSKCTTLIKVFATLLELFGAN